MTPVTFLEAAMHTALEGVALTQAQQRVLFNPSPEGDSLAERVAGLQRHGVPRHVVRGLLADISTVLELNALQAGYQTALAGELDRLASAARLGDGLTVRGLVRVLRAPLSTLLTPETATAAELVEARRVVKEVIRCVPRERICSPTLAHELGAHRHQKLLEFTEPLGTEAA